METSLKEKIIKLRKEGKSYSEIRKELKCSSGYISDVCKLVGLNNIGLNISKRLDAKEIEELRLFYKTHTKKETSIRFGVSEVTVIKYSDNKRILLNDIEKRKNNYKSVKSFRIKTKERAVRYKGGKCIICGYNRCFNSLDFHHLDPKTKDFTISSNCNKAWDKIKKELDKCVLVCANCHSEIHAEFIKLDYNSVVE